MTVTKEEYPPQITNSYYSQNFELTNEELRKHFRLANREIDKAKEKVNDLVVIVHTDNKDWSLKKICEYIAGKNDDLAEFGFSAKTIMNYLNEQNRQLIDTKHRNKKVDTGLKPSQELEDLRNRKGETIVQNNVIEHEHESLHVDVPEDSSITSVDKPIEQDEDKM